MANTSRLLLFMIAVEVIGILAILGGIVDLVPNEGLISASVLINIGAVFIALGGLGVAKIYDGETLLGDGGYPEPTDRASPGAPPHIPPDLATKGEGDEKEVEEDDPKPEEEEQSISSGSGTDPSFVDIAAVDEQLAGHSVSSDFYDALDEEVSEMIEQAAQRAEEDDRTTVQPKDL